MQANIQTDDMDARIISALGADGRRSYADVGAEVGLSTAAVHERVKKLLDKAATLTLTEDETATLASRLTALELQLTPAERAELDQVAGISVQAIVRGLVDAVDPDKQAHAIEGAADPDAAVQQLLDRAIEPLAANPELRNRILELRRAHDQIIDEVSVDVLLDAHGVVDTDRARSVVESWSQYLAEHRDEISAIQLMTEARERRISFDDIQELADRISRPPYNWTPEVIWAAYEALEAGRVRRSTRHTLTDLVSLMRFTIGEDQELVPYADRVRERYAAWLVQQEQAGAKFSDTERWWLDRMVEVIASSAGITAEDLDRAPFTDRGGADGALRDLGEGRTGELLDELNKELPA